VKILVTVKRVEDYESKIKVKPDNSWIVTEGVNYRANPFDEIAVEEALRLRDSNLPSEVVVVSVGPAAAAAEIRSGLAMGADRGILVKHDAFVDSDGVARVIKAIVEQEKPDLVLMGKQAVDVDDNVCGQLVERAEDDPLRSARRHGRFQLALLLSVFHHLGDQVDVRGQLLPIGRLEELRALPQLHDQHRGEVRVPLDHREVHLDEPAQARGGVRLLGQRGAGVREELGHLLVEQPQQEVVLALEIQVDGAVGDAGRAGDLGDRRAEEAPLGEHLHRRVQDARSLVVAGLQRLHRGRLASPGVRPAHSRTSG